MNHRPVWSRRPMRFVAVMSALAALAVACSPPDDIESDSSASPVTPSPTQPAVDVEATGSAADATSVTVNGLDGVTVAVIGDSLTLSAHDQIEQAFTSVDAEVVGFDALDGRRMVQGTTERPGGLAAVESATDLDPDVWVIALGTNDVGAQADPDELEADVSAILDAVDAPVAWIDVFLGPYTPESAAFGQLVRDQAAERPHVVVGDWFHEALDLNLLVDDQVHLTDAGKERFADLMVETAGRSAGT